MCKQYCDVMKLFVLMNFAFIRATALHYLSHILSLTPLLVVLLLSPPLSKLPSYGSVPLPAVTPSLWVSTSWHSLPAGQYQR